MDFLEYLLQKGVIEASERDEYLKGIREGKLPEELIAPKNIPDDVILKAKEEYYRLPGYTIGGKPFPKDVADVIPEKSIEHYRILPIRKANGMFEIGMVNPDDVAARDALDFIAAKENVPYKIFVITLSDFDRSRDTSEKLESEVDDALVDLEGELSDKAEGVDISKEQTSSNEDVPTRIVEEAPITKIVATILRYATEGGASDVHIEPLDTKVRVRFRIDGVMRTSLMLPKDVEQAVVARIKILSSMKLDEKRKPQDGRFSAHIDGAKIDFRVSTFPTYHGEKVVMRILNSDAALLNINELGLSERNAKLIHDAINLPYGLVLISGPTGSGKSTTLYSMLNELDRETQNVLSLEDPVEYNIPGISQSSVRPEIGYDFATGLRTTLRQDPDVIMVGEIRDKETAQLAIQAALTGHLVLSTIHTNSAVGVIPRLVDMGIDPYLIAPTLKLAIAQRLVRKLCPGAGKAIPVEGSVAQMISRSFTDLPVEHRTSIHIPEFVYESAPSSDCPNGTRGRIAVVETFWVTKEIEHIILTDPSEPQIYAQARKDGMLTMKEDALLKSFKREIPFEEINSV